MVCLTSLIELRIIGLLVLTFIIECLYLQHRCLRMVAMKHTQ
nr:MAG TPA: hypothetical protein [Crassvirales sp.]